VPYYLTSGNHDLYQADAWEDWKAVFGPSAYSITVAGRVKFIFMDTADGSIGQSQFDWLEEELGGAERYKIVGTHFPCYDGLNPGIYRLASSTERLKLQSLLRRGRVYAYIAGHIHAWRETEIDGVPHYICALSPGGMDYGRPGYMLFTCSHGDLSWERVEIPEEQ
jgi:hypothetical protein